MCVKRMNGAESETKSETKPEPSAIDMAAVKAAIGAALFALYQRRYDDAAALLINADAIIDGAPADNGGGKHKH